MRRGRGTLIAILGLVAVIGGARLVFGFVLALPDGVPCAEVTAAEAAARGADFSARSSMDMRGLGGGIYVNTGFAGQQRGRCTSSGSIFSCDQPGPALVSVRAGNLVRIFDIPEGAEAVIAGRWDQAGCVLHEPAA